MRIRSPAPGLGAGTRRPSVPEPPFLFLVGLGGLLLAGLLCWPERGLISRWRDRRELSRRALQEDTLKHALQDELAGQPTTLRSIARQLGLSTGRMTSLLTDLQTAGRLTLVGEEIQLTAAGRAEASRIIRAHRLWERHLADDTGFAASEWHELAEKQEHRLTPAEAESLARQLGQPAQDPHGDPIPTADGELVLHAGRSLVTLTAGELGRITHVEDEPAEVYARIVAAGLAAGAIVRVVEASPEGVRLRANGDEYFLPALVAANIAVLPIPPETPIELPGGEPLSALRPGERGQVVGFAVRCRGAERRRMLDLGILPGTTIEAVMTSPGGDPTAYRIREALIALRREQAGLIRVVRSAERQA